MKKGDKVMFTGSTIEQVRWGNNNDPNEIMKEGDIIEIERVEVHSWHTKLYFVGIAGKFNSASFSPVPDYINPNPKKVSEEDLKKVLHELHEKHESDRKQAQTDLNNALRDGFRCI
jgi:hypothetical protein